MIKVILPKQGLTVLLFLSMIAVISLPSLAAPLALDLHLKPEYNGKGNATGIEINYILPDKAGQNKWDLSLLFYKMEPFLERITDQVTDLKVYDNLGEVTFGKPGTITNQDRIMQQWIATRQVSGTVKVSYRVPVAVSFPAKRGPHMDLQAAGGGLSGTLGSFLLMPEPSDFLQVNLVWELPAHHSAISTFGIGNCTISGNFDHILSCQFLAGPLSVYPDHTSEKGFSMYALGRTSSEIQALGKWSQRSYEALRQRLNGSLEDSFRFFIRSYDGGPLQSGIATHGSFLIYLPPIQSASDQDLQALVAHEMVHAFLLGLSSATEGLDDWYNEGIADYLSIKIPYDAGLYTPEQYLQLVNEESALYYTNAFRETPEKEVPAIKWSGRNAWSLGYSRGALYFANLDAKLRKVKNGKVSVVSLVNTITDYCKKGQQPNDSTWVILLREQAGDWAVRDWEMMIIGKLILPEPDAFPGLMSHPIKIGLFDMGFDLPKSIRAGERIKGLVKGSAAEQAGLHEGDKIATTISINPTYSSYTLPVTITVRREGRLIPITFQPHKGQVQGIKWTLVSKRK